MPPIMHAQQIVSTVVDNRLERVHKQPMSHADDLLSEITRDARRYACAHHLPGGFALTWITFGRFANARAIAAEAKEDAVERSERYAAEYVAAHGACCDLGRVVQCVCARSTDCERHGRRCEGGHE